MSIDHTIYPMDFPSQQDEWLEFEALFQMPSEFLDSNPTSVESISPRDLDQSFSDADFLNWDSDPAMFSQAMIPDLANMEAPIGDFCQPAFDPLQSFINPNDVLQPLPAASQSQSIGTGFDSAWVPDAQSYSDFRYMVESQAASDPRCFSQKEKRRDASIALHMQRASDFLSSPVWSESSLEAAPNERSSMTPATSFVSESQTPSSSISGPDSGASSMQLVLDLNMNTTTNVPKKQKPRSKAQRENYIKARKYGVCEKHRKQHKRCNCLEKAAAAHLNANVPCAGANTISNMRTNHERVLVNASPQRSALSPTGSTNTGSLRPLVKQSNRVPRPDLSTLPSQPSPTSSAGCEQVTIRRPTAIQKQTLSSTLPTQRFISSTGHDRAAPTTSQLLVTNNGSPQTAGLWRDKNSEKTQRTKVRPDGERLRGVPRERLDIQNRCSRLRLGEEDSRQVLRERFSNQDTQGTLAQSGSRRTQTSQQTTGATDTPLTRRLVAHASRTATGLFSFLQPSVAASAASSFLGRLVVFSSRLIIQSRKGMGFI
ncbi:hypothetical protein BJY04DRAFT_126853 [Aspergillus karnatakaensis]|uniref:uncharacterized protein n=1 Tax=Aspergillus karnatakaensis TaxID=1810916 RepID=UPI003CCDC270